MMQLVGGVPRHVFIDQEVAIGIAARDEELLEQGHQRIAMDNENNEREPHATDRIQVSHTFHSWRTTGLVVPMFATKWFQRNHALFTIIPGQPDAIESTVQCFTEIKHLRHGTIRCHPNYQSDGPWRDWVKANFKKTGTTVARLYLCQVICFIKMPQTRLDVPGCVLLRTTHTRSEQDYNESSVLFHRWRKDYDEDAEANVQMVSIDRIKSVVGVVDENPEMIADRHGVSSFLNTAEERQLLTVDLGARQYCKDIVWEVLPIEKWCDEFCEKATRRVQKIVQPDSHFE
jgi:hypothetical protein